MRKRKWNEKKTRNLPPPRVPHTLTTSFLPHFLHPSGDGNVNGYGLEFYIEAPPSELAPSVHDAKASWQFQLLYTVSQLAAGHGGIRAIMDEMRLLSTEAEGVAAALPPSAAAAHVNAAGRVGALLGLRSRPGDADGECVGVCVGWEMVEGKREETRQKKTTLPPSQPNHQPLPTASRACP